MNGDHQNGIVTDNETRKEQAKTRTDPATAHIPVVALSANAMPRDIAKAMEAGFFRYLTKPIKVKEFMDALNATLEFAESGLAQKE